MGHTKGVESCCVALCILGWKNWVYTLDGSIIILEDGSDVLQWRIYNQRSKTMSATAIMSRGFFRAGYYDDL